ncbi:MAG: hypothetical protein ACXW2I_15165 [Burkholderiales bacterium]
MLSAPTIAISPSLFTKLNYDALRDLAPVTLVAAMEAGVDDFVVPIWYGILRARRHAARNRRPPQFRAPQGARLRRPEGAFSQRRRRAAHEHARGVRRFINSEMGRYAKVIKAAGIKFD